MIIDRNCSCMNSGDRCYERLLFINEKCWSSNISWYLFVGCLYDRFITLQHFLKFCCMRGNIKLTNKPKRLCWLNEWSIVLSESLHPIICLFKIKSENWIKIYSFGLLPYTLGLVHTIKQCFNVRLIPYGIFWILNL